MSGVINEIPVRARDRDRTAGHHPESTEDMTKQEFKDDCDITKVMGKWRKRGFDGPPPHVNPAEPVFGDFTTGRDLEEAMLQVHEAKEAFRLLDSHIRERVDNDPAKFIDFCSDPENAAEMAEMGLLVEDHPVEALTKQFEAFTRAFGDGLGDPSDAINAGDVTQTPTPAAKEPQA